MPRKPPGPVQHSLDVTDWSLADLIAAHVSGRIPPGATFDLEYAASAFPGDDCPTRICLTWEEMPGA